MQEKNASRRPLGLKLAVAPRVPSPLSPHEELVAEFCHYLATGQMGATHQAREAKIQDFAKRNRLAVEDCYRAYADARRHLKINSSELWPLVFETMTAACNDENAAVRVAASDRLAKYLAPVGSSPGEQRQLSHVELVRACKRALLNPSPAMREALDDLGMRQPLEAEAAEIGAAPPSALKDWGR